MIERIVLFNLIRIEINVKVLFLEENTDEIVNIG
jgi:hypothetical protein